jgi:hypothetical protein
MSGRISIPICIVAAAAALLVSGIGTDLRATTRANDCLTAPNASSPRGQRWYYHIDLLNNRKCWYLHAPSVHGAAKASGFHALSTAADTPASGSRADSVPRLHTRKLSAKPQPTSLVNTESIRQSDAHWAPQQRQGSTPQVDGSTDAVAPSSPATAKPIEQSDADWALQQPQGSAPQVDGSTDAVAPSSPPATKPIEQSDADWTSQLPQGSAPQVDGTKPTEAVAAPSPAAAKPKQSEADWAPQQPQGSAPQVDGTKPTDAVAAPSPPAAKPIEQSDAPSVTQQLQGSTLSRSTDAIVPSSPATATLRVADANSAPPDADPEAFDDGGRITERSKPTVTADIVRGLSFKPVQMFLFLVLGVAIVVFLISLVIILHHRVTALVDHQLDHDRPEARAQHGLQDDGARSSQRFVDDQRGQEGIDALPWPIRPSATRPQIGEATSTEPPPRSSSGEVKAALEDFRAELIYVDRTQRSRRGQESPTAP